MKQFKVQEAIERIQKAYDRFGNEMFLGHSGGKDSQVILHLTKQVTDDFIIVHNVKPLYYDNMNEVEALTAMYPETLEFLYSEIAGKQAVEFMPATMMEEFLIEADLHCQIDGARIVEGERAGKSANIIRDGENVSRSEMTDFEEKGIFDLSICYPIYDWADEDVFDYLMANDILISDEYVNNGELDAYYNSKQ